MGNFGQTKLWKRRAGFTLAEALVSIAVLSSATAGLILGYIQSNRRAQWCAMSLAAQSLASQSVERARAAKWDIHSQVTGTGPGTSDELPPTNYVQVVTNAMLVSATGKPMGVTNYVSISQSFGNPPVRQIRADCVWRSPVSQNWITNTVVTYRMADE